MSNVIVVDTLIITKFIISAMRLHRSFTSRANLTMNNDIVSKFALAKNIYCNGVKLIINKADIQWK